MLGGGFRRHIESCRWDNTIDRSFSFRDDVEKRPESSGLGAGSIRICACQTQFFEGIAGVSIKIHQRVQIADCRFCPEDALEASEGRHLNIILGEQPNASAIGLDSEGFEPWVVFPQCLDHARW